MASENKKIEKKKQEKPQKGKAFVDTSNSKVVKGTSKTGVEQDDKAVVEKINNKKLEKSNNVIESKFNVGDKVYYIPELSGMDKEKGLIIKFKKYEKPDSLLGEETDYNWYYTFEDSNLRAVESDLTDSLQSLSESSATEDDIDMEDDKADSDEEKESSNTPETKSVSESVEDDSSSDILDEFREMAKASENLEAFINSIRRKNDVTVELSTAFFKKYGQDGKTPEQAAETLYNEVKYSMNENIHQDMKRLIHLMALKESANELVNKFGLTNIDSIKKSLVEELTDNEYKIVLEDVYKALKIEVENDYKDVTESVNESLRTELGKKLI